MDCIRHLDLEFESPSSEIFESQDPENRVARQRVSNNISILIIKRSYLRWAMFNLEMEWSGKPDCFIIDSFVSWQMAVIS